MELYLEHRRLILRRYFQVLGICALRGDSGPCLDSKASHEDNSSGMADFETESSGVETRTCVGMFAMG
jgi:hypothetical protein